MRDEKENSAADWLIIKNLDPKEVEELWKVFTNPPEDQVF
jgi:hypothetical protein